MFGDHAKFQVFQTESDSVTVKIQVLNKNSLQIMFTKYFPRFYLLLFVRKGATSV